MEPSSERERLVEIAADIELDQTNVVIRPPAAPRWFYASTTAVGVLGLLLLATQPASRPVTGASGTDTQPKATQLPPPPPSVVPDSASRAGARAVAAAVPVPRSRDPLPISGSYAGRSSSSPRVLRRAVLVLADYMATSDIEPFAPSTSEIATPRLRRMAAEGVIFTSFYTASPICGPSRASLLSGLYPRHVGLEVNLVEGDPGLPPSVPTLPRKLSDAGWATSLSGKCTPNGHPSATALIRCRHILAVYWSRWFVCGLGAWQGILGTTVPIVRTRMVLVIFLDLLTGILDITAMGPLLAVAQALAATPPRTCWCGTGNQLQQRATPQICSQITP